MTDTDAQLVAQPVHQRGLRLALLLVLAGAGLLLFALGRVWVRVEGVSGLTIGSVYDTVTGGDVATGALACSYVGLAAVVALVATRGWVRTAVGAFVAAVAVGALVDVLPLTVGTRLTSRAFRTLAQCDSSGCSSRAEMPPSFSGWPYLASLGALLLLAGGILVVARGRRWAGLSSSYEAPGGAPEPVVTDKGVWDALDRGDDPTA